MYYRVEHLIPPTTPAVDINFVKQFARVSNTVDDGIIASFISLATEQAEQYLNRVIGTQTLQLTIAYTPVPQTYGYYGYTVGAWQTFYPGVGALNRKSIDLLYNPVQQIISVGQGFWNQYPDTYLTAGVDYYCDLSASPARVQLLTQNFSACGPDHVSIQYVAGYGWTNLIQIAGTSTATTALTLTVGGQSVSVTVNAGDTAATVIANTQAAIIAVPGTPSAAVLSANMIQLRADNVAVTVGSVPTGLTVTAGIPQSAVPAGITNAITYLTANLYQNMADPMEQAPEWFYSMLDPFRMRVFS